MGEAKRRRDRLAQEAGLERPPALSELVQIRTSDEIVPSELLRQNQIRVEQNRPIQVPCGSCTACCRQEVQIQPSYDSLKHLKTVRREGRYYLEHRPDGACIHLGEKGCTVYEHRPLMCRMYDCRLPQLIFSAAKINNPKLYGPRWKFNWSGHSEEDLIIIIAACAAVALHVENWQALEFINEAELEHTFEEQMDAARRFIEECNALPDDQALAKFTAALDEHQRMIAAAFPGTKLVEGGEIGLTVAPG